MLKLVRALRGRRITRVASLAACGTVLIASLIQVPDAPINIAHSDKWLHATSYALLMMLVGWGWPGSPARLVSGVSLLCMGLVIEWIQHLLPWRSMEWLDLMANGVGLLIGSIVLCGLERLSRSR